MKRLGTGYTAEVGRIDKEGWFQIIGHFRDASIYQTWSYDAVRFGANKISHLILKKDGDIVAAAQVRIVRIPIVKIGVAYVFWGPLWRSGGGESDVEVFRQAIRALRNEYACQRRLVVRIFPILFDEESEVFNPILIEEGFSLVPIEGTKRTLLINLSRSLGELRNGLDRKWRNHLNRAEKNNLKIVEGFDDDLFGSFIEIYRQMHGRKRFIEGSDVNEFRMMQHDLPNSLKMKILIAFSDGKPAAGVVCSGIGDMGVYLFGGTSDAGLSSQGSYLLQWKALSWLKEKGATWYNLHGINPKENPGTYNFKAGLCGRNGKDVCFLGVYDAFDGVTTRNIFRFANFTRVMYRKGKVVLNRLRG